MGKKSRLKKERQSRKGQVKDGLVVCGDCGLEQSNPTPRPDGSIFQVTTCVRCDSWYGYYSVE